MKFYCILDDKEELSEKDIVLMAKTCRERDIEFIALFPEMFNYFRSNIKPNSLIYRIGIGRKSRIIEKHVINDSHTSFYSDTIRCIDNRSSSFLYNAKEGLPIIKTIPDFLSNKNLLHDYVDYVGGFPVIVKVTGNTHGVGVIKVDSMDSLKSLGDFFENNDINPILREFINHKKQGRLIVLGDKVIASHVNYALLDFRSNVGENSKRIREHVTFPDEVQKLAVDAVRNVGIEFGGVDILFDESTHEPFIAEVNFPCFFQRTQELTGIDIAGLMIDYLLEKQKRVENN